MEVDDLNDFSDVDFGSFAIRENYLDGGGYGRVYGPITVKGNIYALKEVLLKEDRRNAMRKKFETKKDIWISLEHVNLIKIHFVKLIPNASYILMGFAAGGSLSSTLRNIQDSELNLPVDVVINWTEQIAEGMLYLHERKLVHRDLKPGNIMLVEPFDFNNADKPVALKIADFDDISQHENTVTMSFIGTAPYMAPEVLKTQQFSKSSDVWSFGVVLWEIVMGKVPHEGIRQVSLMVMASEGELCLPVPDSAPQVFRQLITVCMSEETINRPSFQEIVHWVRFADPALKHLAKINSFNPVLFHTVRTKAYKSKEIRGLAILDGELFVVSEWSSEIEVYDSIELRLSRVLNLKVLVDPVDLGSSPRNKSLYIVDKKFVGNSVEVKRVDRNGQLLRKWQIRNDYCRMSVTNESTVLLTFYERHEIDEYSPKGKLIRKIKLSRSICPLYAVKLAHNRFLVSNGCNSSHRVCLVDANGKVTIEKSFGGIWSADGLRNDQTYMFIKKKGGAIILDQAGSRLFLLDNSLTLVENILREKLDLRCLHSILLDEPNRRLFLADNIQDSENAVQKDGCILIFNY